MTRGALIASVAFASYAVISTLLSAVVVTVWHGWAGRMRHATPGARASWLGVLRLAPFAGGALLTLAVVVPVFVAFEPVREFERTGPLLIALALGGVLLLGLALARALGTAFVTWRVQRAWLQSATTLDIDPPAGVPAYVVDSIPPTVALIGVFSPRLVAARTVIDACTREELAAIVAHERGHLHAHDNLKRWLMSCAPDVLSFTRVHGEIGAAWRDAAEDAADDRATRGQEQARVDLAALLIKVARLVPAGAASGPGSSFADRDGLDRRVRRLLADTPAPIRRGLAGPLLAIALAVVVAGVIAEAASFRDLYEAIEFTVALGR